MGKTSTSGSKLIFSAKIEAEYYYWLCDIINVDQYNVSYWLLIKKLQDTEFIDKVPNDDNRIDDGKKLRDIFADETGYTNYTFLDGPCSMLEMLIGLSIRIEDILEDCEEGDRTRVWFWEMIKNLGLDKYDDESYFDHGGSDAIVEILDKLINRKYGRNGNGGLFPLKDAKKDQRNVEIWYQMCAYLLENYYIDGEIM